MKKYLFFLLLSSLCLSQTKSVQSKVVQATVFKDRAMVTQSADINLNKGENQVVFSDLTTE